MPRGERGFTLTEMMVVVAIIAILAGLAAAKMNTQSYAGTVRGYGSNIMVEMNTARMRATASGKWQRLAFDGQTFAVYEARTPGQGTPVDWDLIETHKAPAHVQIASLSYATHLTPGSAPAAGSNLPGFIDFAPDGTSMPASVFLSDDRELDPHRVIVYRASGSSYLKKGW